MGPNQTQKLLHSKGSQKQAKRQLKEWEKIFTNDVINKGLCSKIYEQLMWLKNKQTNQQTNNPVTHGIGRRPKQTFLQRHIDCQEAHEKMLNNVNYQKMQTITIKNITSHQSAWPASKILQTINAGEVW